MLIFFVHRNRNKAVTFCNTDPSVSSFFSNELKSMIGQDFTPLSRNFDFTILDHRNTPSRKGLNNEVPPKKRHVGPKGE